MADEEATKPDEIEKLDRYEKKKAQEWLNRHWTVSTNCPISGHNDWTVSDHIVQPITRAEGALKLGGPVYPSVLVICGGCGYTLMFNAVVMGLVPGTKRDADE